MQTFWFFSCFNVLCLFLRNFRLFSKKISVEIDWTTFTSTWNWWTEWKIQLWQLLTQLLKNNKVASHLRTASEKQLDKLKRKLKTHEKVWGEKWGKFRTGNTKRIQYFKWIWLHLLSNEGRKYEGIEVFGVRFLEFPMIYSTPGWNCNSILESFLIIRIGMFFFCYIWKQKIRIWWTQILVQI